jgi:hypothetical protein
MGQYYYPVALSADNQRVEGYVYSHDIKEKFKRDDGKVFMMGSGLKLMEHSWLKNGFVRAVERLLIPGGEWHHKAIVWAGDYAAPEEHTGENFHSMAGGSSDEGESISVKIIPKPLSQKESTAFRFIVNHTTKEFVDKTKIPDRDGWRIHPLPLLTAEGNGQGGGDFRGSDPKGLIGSWARCTISIEKQVPEGFKELKFNLTE